MAGYLGFDLDKTHIKHQIYFPDGYGALEDENTKIRKAILEILNGTRPLPMRVVNLPIQEATTATPSPKATE